MNGFDDTTARTSGAQGPTGSDDGFEQLLRFRLHQLADHAPTTVRSIDEIRVEHLNRPSAAARRRGRHRRTAGIGATVAALLGAVGFTTVALTGAGTAGAASPEAAVAEFLDAAGDEDVLGMVDALDPTEVGVVRSGLQEARAEAVSADIVTESFSLDDLSGLDLSFTDLSFTAEPLVEGVTVVEVGGAVGWSLDPATFPAGSEVAELLGDGGAGSAALDEIELPSVVVAVERDGRWFVSGSYTVLEWLRQVNDLPAPTTVLPAVGAATPEQAATGFLGGLVGGDIEGAFAITPPGEGDAVRTYAPILAAELDGAMAGTWASGFDLALSDVGYTVEGDGARRWLTPTSFTITGTVPEPVRYDVFNPEMPTVIGASDGTTFYVLPAGEPIPATVDGLEPVGFEGIPEEMTNYTLVDEQGNVEPLAPAPVSDGPDAIEIVRADGCTTVSGPGIESALGLPVGSVEEIDERYTFVGQTGYEQLDTDTWRICERTSSSPFREISLVAGAGVALELPSIEVVEVDGSWYVSPTGSTLGTVRSVLAEVGNAGSLLDSEIGLVVLGTNRATLEAILVGAAPEGLSPACRSLVVGEPTVTGLRDDITAAEARACALGTMWAMDAEFVEEPIAVTGTVPAAEVVPASTVTVPVPVDTGG